MLPFHVWNPGFLAHTTTDFKLLVQQSVTGTSEMNILFWDLREVIETIRNVYMCI